MLKCGSLAISSDDAIFATPGVNIGLFCSTPMVAVSRKVSRKKTMKMILTGDPINAVYAKEIGLINDYYPILRLEEEVLKLAKKLHLNLILQLRLVKKLFINN